MRSVALLLVGLGVGLVSEVRAETIHCTTEVDTPALYGRFVSLTLRRDHMFNLYGEDVNTWRGSYDIDGSVEQTVTWAAPPATAYILKGAGRFQGLFEFDPDAKRGTLIHQAGLKPGYLTSYEFKNCTVVGQTPQPSPPPEPAPPLEESCEDLCKDAPNFNRCMLNCYGW